MKKKASVYKTLYEQFPEIRETWARLVIKRVLFDLNRPFEDIRLVKAFKKHEKENKR